MSSTAKPSILASLTAKAPNRSIPPWRWGSNQITAFGCNIVDGKLADLLQSCDAGFNIGHTPLEMLHFTTPWHTPCNDVSQALCSGIPNDRGSGISTDPFADTPLLLRFGKKEIIMPGECVIAKLGVPLVAHNTAVDFHEASQMFKHANDVEGYSGVEFNDVRVRAMNMGVIIALAQRQAVAVEMGCIASRDVFEVGAIYIPHEAQTIDIYTAKVTREYLQDLKHPERALRKDLTITKTQIDLVADKVKGLGDCLRFIMASVANTTVLKPMENVGEPVKLVPYRLD